MSNKGCLKNVFSSDLIETSRKRNTYNIEYYYYLIESLNEHVSKTGNG